MTTEERTHLCLTFQAKVLSHCSERCWSLHSYSKSVLMDFVSFFLCSVWRHHQCHRPNRWWVWSADMYIMRMAGWDTHGAALTVQKTSLFSVALIVCSHVFAAFRCICLWPGAAVYSRGHQAAVLHELLHRGDEDCLETQVRFNEMLYLTLLSTFKINRIQIFTFKPETEQHHLDQHASTAVMMAHTLCGYVHTVLCVLHSLSTHLQYFR